MKRLKRLIIRDSQTLKSAGPGSSYPSSSSSSSPHHHIAIRLRPPGICGMKIPQSSLILGPRDSGSVRRVIWRGEPEGGGRHLLRSSVVVGSKRRWVLQRRLRGCGTLVLHRRLKSIRCLSSSRQMVYTQTANTDSQKKKISAAYIQVKLYTFSLGFTWGDDDLPPVSGNGVYVVFCA